MARKRNQSEVQRLLKLIETDPQDVWEEPDLARRVDFQSLATAEGAEFKALALRRLLEAGARIRRVRYEIDGFPVDAEIVGRNQQAFLVLARGTPDEKTRSGFRRTDTVQKAGFVAMQLSARSKLPILLVTSDLPERGKKPGRYLAALSPYVWDVLATRDDFRGFQRLQETLTERLDSAPPAPWRDEIVDDGALQFDPPTDLAARRADDSARGQKERQRLPWMMS